MMSIPQFDVMNQSEISKEKKLNKQKLIDICFQIALTINNDKYFSKELSDEEIAEWVRIQLSNCGFKTEPCGSSWALLK